MSDSNEIYGLSWPGRAASLARAKAPPTGRLAPRLDRSIDFDDAAHVFIEGDNLEVLKLLQRSYHRAVKLMYVDPPYNTGSDFLYADDFRDLRVNDAGGRIHSRWLDMMAPRLSLARELLAPDGVILVSIDDHEVASLRLLMNEIFGEASFLTTLIWNKQHSQQQGIFKRYHEYVLAFAKDPTRMAAIEGGEGIIEAGALKRVSRQNPASEFAFPAGVRFDAPDGRVLEDTYGEAEQVTVVRGRLVAEGGRTAEPVTLSAGWTQKNQMTDWFAGKEVFDTRGQKVLEFFFSGTGKLKCRKERGRITPPSILPEYGMVSAQTEHLAKMFGKPVFDNPKPVAMIRDFVKWFAGEGDIVLDFFAGSGTTCEAVLLEGGARFVAVQVPEVIRDGSAAGKNARALGFETISELAIERVRKVIATHGLDAGVRVLSLVEGPATTDDERVAEILLREGLSLTAPIVRVSDAVWESGSLTISLENRLDVDRIEKLFEHAETLVTLDSAFDDARKLEALGVATRAKKTLRTV